MGPARIRVFPACLLLKAGQGTGVCGDQTILLFLEGQLWRVEQTSVCVCAPRPPYLRPYVP